MSTEYEREANFNRAQARYDAMEPPEGDEREPVICGHCDREACGEWSEGEVDEDGNYDAPHFSADTECDLCGKPLCVKCIDGEEDGECPGPPPPREPYVPNWKRAGYESYTAWLKGEFAKQDAARERMKTLFHALAPRRSDFE